MLPIKRQKAYDMGFLTKVFGKVLPEPAQKKVIKHEVKKLVNDKLGLDGELNPQVDELADKVIEKVGISNILKIKEAYDKLNTKD